MATGRGRRRRAGARGRSPARDVAQRPSSSVPPGLPGLRSPEVCSALRGSSAPVARGFPAATAAPCESAPLRPLLPSLSPATPHPVPAALGGPPCSGGLRGPQAAGFQGAGVSEAHPALIAVPPLPGREAHPARAPGRFL